MDFTSFYSIVLSWCLPGSSLLLFPGFLLLRLFGLACAQDVSKIYSLYNHVAIQQLVPGQ